MLLRATHRIVLLSARILLQEAPAQGPRWRRNKRQNGRVLQVHAVQGPPDEFGRGGRRHDRRDRADDRAKIRAETGIHARRPTSE